ncbi:MAG: homoserine O-succinyltransferase [Acidimicrobiia bacterium]
MPLIAHNGLPAFDRLRLEGRDVVSPDEMDGGLPSIRIGLLNLMPDAALEATERQFIRLVTAYDQEANLYVYPFTLAAEARSHEARAHIRAHYSTFEQLKEFGLDALIITGANPVHVDLVEEAYWTGMVEVLDWAVDGVRSTMCSCLAAHAYIRHHRGINRTRLPRKCWGVFSHHVVSDHFLLDGVVAPVEAPHSHFFNLTAEDFEGSGARLLMVGEHDCVHMAVSDEEASFVFFQGHPEYDGLSLLKEYKREVSRFFAGVREDYPPFPEQYFDPDVVELLAEYQTRVVEARAEGREMPEFPESAISIAEPPAWSAAGMQIYRNWLAEVSRRAGS